MLRDKTAGTTAEATGPLPDHFGIFLRNGETLTELRRMDYSDAIKGRDALKIVWEDGPNANYDSTAYKATLEASVRKPGKPGRTIGDAERALAAGPKRLEREYYVPHLSHAQMEPVAAVARFSNGSPTRSPS